LLRKQRRKIDRRDREAREKSRPLPGATQNQVWTVMEEDSVRLFRDFIDPGSNISRLSPSGNFCVWIGFVLVIPTPQVRRQIIRKIFSDKGV
jgi:hypothetical protein